MLGDSDGSDDGNIDMEGMSLGCELGSCVSDGEEDGWLLLLGCKEGFVEMDGSVEMEGRREIEGV